MRLKTQRNIPRNVKARMESLDMVGNMKDVMNIYQQLKQNPMQVLNQCVNGPQNLNLSNPYDIIQHLLNPGQRTQEQLNSVMNMKNQFR